MKKSLHVFEKTALLLFYPQPYLYRKATKSLLMFGMAFLFLTSGLKAQSDYSRLFWPNYDNDRIEKINLDASGQITAVSNASGVATWGPVGIAVDVPHGKIYWFEDYNKQIKRANLDGSNVEVFATSTGWAYTLFVDTKNSYLYWPNYEADKIERINLDGTGRTTVVSNASGVATYGPVGITVDTKNGKIYWFEDYNKRIKRSNLDGSSVEVFATGTGWAYSLYVDKQNSKLYWPNYEADKIERMNLDGTGRANVVTGASGVATYGPIGITLDLVNNKIYWFEDAGKSIKRANLDGSSVSTFIASTGWAYNLVIPFDETIATLPVTFVQFTAQRNNDKIALNWQTAREEGAKDFTVQFSTDGTSWKNLGVIPAKGNSVGLLNYSFEHSNPVNGKNYYRLLQTDNDGYMSYSQVRLINLSSEKNIFQLMGNPATGNIIKIQMLQKAEISIYDSKAQLLYKATLDVGIHEVPAVKFGKGVCFIKSGSTTQKIIIQ